MLIVDKPAGLVVISHGHATGTLVHALVGRAHGARRAYSARSPASGGPDRASARQADIGTDPGGQDDAAQASLMGSSGSDRRLRSTWRWCAATRRPRAAASRRRSVAIRETGSGWRWSAAAGRP